MFQIAEIVDSLLKDCPVLASRNTISAYQNAIPDNFHSLLIFL